MDKAIVVNFIKSKKYKSKLMKFKTIITWSATCI